MENVRLHVLDTLMQRGLVQAHAKDERDFVMRWTPRGADFRERMKQCINDAGLGDNAHELAALISIVLFMENID